MANQLTALDMELWEKETQALLEESAIFMDIATMRDAKWKKIIHNPYYVRWSVQTYTTWNDQTDNDIVSVVDDMNTFTTKYYNFVYDETEALDTEYDVVMGQREIAAYKLRMEMEKAFFEEYSNAKYASASAVALDTTNTYLTFADAKATLTTTWANDKNIVTVVDDFVVARLGNYVNSNGFQLADETMKRWYRWEFNSSRLYSSSSLVATTALQTATNPTAWDTFTIAWVTFTFVSSIGTTAWNILIEATAALTTDNIVVAINGWAGAGTKYVEVAWDDRDILRDITATDWTTYVWLSMRGYRIVSSNMTAAANDFDAVVLNCLVMERWAIDFALRSPVQLISEKIQKRLAYRYSAWCNYGKKTFTQNKKRIYNVKVAIQAAEA